jgi:hypothetical protein
MRVFEPGAVFTYNYLWKRQHALGEESGRKPRPSCIVFRSSRSPAELFLFPITTRRPLDGSRAIEVPVAERRRCGLDKPCWVVIEEYNITLESRVYDFQSLDPLGRFSDSFLIRLAVEIRAAIKAGVVSPVARS